jgi:hypothetical protein
MPETTKQRLLRQTAERVGRERLAKSLNVPLELLEAWLSGHSTMPDRKFLELGDLQE